MFLRSIKLYALLLITSLLQGQTMNKLVLEKILEPKEQAYLNLTRQEDYINPNIDIDLHMDGFRRSSAKR